jgi:hypothetical protein
MHYISERCLVTQKYSLSVKATKKRTIRMGLKVRGMNAVNERMIAEHPKPRVVRMVEGRGMRVADKTLYW